MKRAFFLLLLVLVACSEAGKAKPVTEVSEKIYTVRGIVKGHSIADNSLHLDHEAIPGFMDAMVMDYPVRGVQVGDLPPDGSRIEAKLHVTDDAFWLTDVKKIP
jgi:protein SCO1/2